MPKTPQTFIEQKDVQAAANEAAKTAEDLPAILRELPAELLGERVFVRPYRFGDGAALWEAVEESRQHFLPWLPWGDKHGTPADSETYARKAQAKWLLREDLSMGIRRRSDGRLLGGTGLHRIKWEVPSFEIGYWLRQSEEGKGYMTETVTLLCRLCFETLNAQRVEIQTDTRNMRSAAIPRRLGFAHEAVLRNCHRDANGLLGDLNMFVLFPEDYARLFAPSA